MTAGESKAGPKTSHREAQAVRRGQLSAAQNYARVVNLLPGELRQLVCARLFDQLMPATENTAAYSKRPAVATSIREALQMVEQAVYTALYMGDQPPRGDFDVTKLNVPQDREQVETRLKGACKLLERQRFEKGIRNEALNYLLDGEKNAGERGASEKPFEGLARAALDAALQPNHIERATASSLSKDTTALG